MCLIILITRPSSGNFNALSFDRNSPLSLLRTILIFCYAQGSVHRASQNVQIFRYTFHEAHRVRRIDFLPEERVIIVETHIYVFATHFASNSEHHCRVSNKSPIREHLNP